MPKLLVRYTHRPTDMASFGGRAKPDRGASLRVISFTHEERLIFDMKPAGVPLSAPMAVLDSLLKTRMSEGFLVAARSDGILTLTREVLMGLSSQDSTRDSNSNSNSKTNSEHDSQSPSAMLQYVIFPPNRARVAAVEIWAEPQDGHVRALPFNPTYLHGATSVEIVQRIRTRDEDFVAALQTFDHLRGLEELAIDTNWSSTSADAGLRLAPLPAAQTPNTLQDARAGASVTLFPVCFRLPSLLRRCQRHDLFLPLFHAPEDTDTEATTDAGVGAGVGASAAQPFVDQVAFAAMIDTRRVSSLSRVPTDLSVESAPAAIGTQGRSRPLSNDTEPGRGHHDASMPSPGTATPSATVTEPCPFALSNILISQFAQAAQRLCDMEVPVEGTEQAAALLAMLDQHAPAMVSEAGSTVLRATAFRCFLKYGENEDILVLLVPMPALDACRFHTPAEAKRCCVARHMAGTQGVRSTATASHNLNDTGRGRGEGTGQDEGVGVDGAGGGVRDSSGDAFAAPGPTEREVPPTAWLVHTFLCKRSHILRGVFDTAGQPTCGVQDLRDVAVANHTVIDAEMAQQPTLGEFARYLADSFTRAYVQSAFLRLQQVRTGCRGV